MFFGGPFIFYLEIVNFSRSTKCPITILSEIARKVFRKLSKLLESRTFFPTFIE